MSRIEITDEMVERATRAAFGNWDRVARVETGTPLYTIRKALEAALAPPEPEEPEVTEEMLDAGTAEVTELAAKVIWQPGTSAVRIFRAMESARRKGEKNCDHLWRETAHDVPMEEWSCMRCGQKEYR